MQIAKTLDLEKFINRNYLAILLIFIFFGTIFRFYNFYGHIALRADTTRDISIAKEALVRAELPFAGSFSSAGLFVFGPFFYWFLMLSYLIMPFTILAPWYLSAIISVMAIFAYAYLGFLIGGRRLSLIIAIIAASSVQLVLSATSLTQHVFVGFTTVLLLIFFTIFWQRKKLIYAFFSGLAIGAALSFHSQAINLFLFFPAILFVPNIKITSKLKAMLYMSFGFLIAYLQPLIWDWQHGFANIRNFLDYLLVAQYRIYVPNSWRLFLFNFLPTYWSAIVGGTKLLGFLSMIVVGVTALFTVLKRRLNSLMLIYFIIFAVLIILNRYYKGERSGGYLYYLSPLILLFSAWSIEQILLLKLVKKWQYLKYVIACTLLIVLVISNLVTFLPKMTYTNSELGDLNKVAAFLKNKYPNKRFSLYEYNNADYDAKYSLSVFLGKVNSSYTDSIPIGICSYDQCRSDLPPITALWGNNIVNLSGITLDSPWKELSQKTIYDSTIGWLREGNLTSNFSLSKYLREKLWPIH